MTSYTTPATAGALTEPRPSSNRDGLTRASTLRDLGHGAGRQDPAALDDLGEVLRHDLLAGVAEAFR